MKKFFSAIMWILVNGAMSYLYYLGIANEHTGVANIMIFWVWFMSICTILSCLLGSAEKTIEKTSNIKLFFDCTYNSLLAIVMIYYGWIATGSIFIISTLLIIGEYNVLKEGKEKENDNI